MLSLPSSWSLRPLLGMFSSHSHRDGETGSSQAHLSPSPYSLSQLPVELQALVVQHTLEADLQSYEDGGDFTISRTLKYENYIKQGQESNPRYPSVEALSRVDRTFATLCAPHLWKEVKLNDKNEADLEYFLQTIAPRHGRHIHKISNSYEKGPYPDVAPFRRVTPSYISSSLTSPPRRRKELHRFVLSAQTTPRLTDFEMDFEQNPGKETLEDLSSYLLDRKNCLRTLVISSLGRQQAQVLESDLADFLRHFRLSSLTISSVNFREDSGDDLPRLLAGLDTLQSLSICNHQLLDSRCSQVVWSCPLTQLHLEDVPELKLSDAAKLVTNFKETLETLALIEFDIDTPSFRHSYSATLPLLQESFRLPRLRNFSIGTHFKVDFLDTFKYTPFQSLTIEASDGTVISTTEWREFLQARQKTLELVTFSVFTELTNEELEELGDSLASLGVGVWDLVNNIYYEPEVQEVQESEEEEEKQELAKS